jgi:hypothetical protein
MMVSWLHTWREDNLSTMRYVRKLKTAIARKVAMIVYKGLPDHELSKVPYQSRFIDIWWVIHDGGLLLLMPYLLTLHKVWRHCTLRLFAVTMTNESPESVAELTAEFLNSVRIDATVVVIKLNVDLKDDVHAKMAQMRNARMNFEAELTHNDEYNVPISPQKQKRAQKTEHLTSDDIDAGGVVAPMIESSPIDETPQVRI